MEICKTASTLPATRPLPARVSPRRAGQIQLGQVTTRARRRFAAFASLDLKLSSYLASSTPTPETGGEAGVGKPKVRPKSTPANAELANPLGISKTPVQRCHQNPSKLPERGRSNRETNVVPGHRLTLESRKDGEFRRRWDAQF